MHPIVGFFGLNPSTPKAKAVDALASKRLTQAQACREYGVSPSVLSAFLQRARRDMARVQSLTGVKVDI